MRHCWGGSRKCWPLQCASFAAPVTGLHGNGLGKRKYTTKVPPQVHATYLECYTTSSGTQRAYHRHPPAERRSPRPAGQWPAGPTAAPWAGPCGAAWRPPAPPRPCCCIHNNTRQGSECHAQGGVGHPPPPGMSGSLVGGAAIPRLSCKDCHCAQGDGFIIRHWPSVASHLRL